MVLKRVNNLILIIIIFCSTSFYSFSILGPFLKIAEILGAGLIIFFLALHAVYGEQKTLRHNFALPIVFILISLFTSMCMANFSRDQSFSQTLFAQRAMYFYLLYFLLHQLKIKPKDLEIIFLLLGILYVILYLIQYTIYPTIIFDAFVRFERGTVRIYLAGSGYMGIAILMSAQYFFRTNRIKYLFMLLIFILIIVLSGGRSAIALYIFILTIFFILDKKVKSRLFLFFLGLVASFALYFIFQDIFNALLSRSDTDIRLGQNYVRITATKFFLTDFFREPLAYITGNGMFANNSSYGLEIRNIMLNNKFFLSDIGIFGNYAIYGAFFLVGIIWIIVKAFKLKIESKFTFLKFFFLDLVLGLFTTGSFTQAHFICLLACALYMVDVSNFATNLSPKHNKVQQIISPNE